MLRPKSVNRQRSTVNHSPSLTPQTLHRIHSRCLNGLETDRGHGNHKGKQAGRWKDPPIERGAVGKILQPVMHYQPCYGRGNHKCNEDQAEKIS